MNVITEINKCIHLLSIFFSITHVHKINENLQSTLAHSHLAEKREFANKIQESRQLFSGELCLSLLQDVFNQ